MRPRSSRSALRAGRLWSRRLWSRRLWSRLERRHADRDDRDVVARVVELEAESVAEHPLGEANGRTRMTDDGCPEPLVAVGGVAAPALRDAVGVEDDRVAGERPDL